MHNTRILMPILLALAFLLTGLVSAADSGSFPVAVQTIQPPENLSVAVQVDQVGSRVTATYRGGFGQMLLKDLQIELIRPDGSSDKKTLGKNVGDFVTFTGTGCGDQILGTATYMNGVQYPFLNQTNEYIPGVCSADYVEAVDPCAEIAASPSLKPEPIVEIPANKSVAIQANVDIQTINVEFRGGFGQNVIKSIPVTRYGPDGTKDTQNLDNRVGATVSYKVTNGCMDRVAADVIFMDGTMYHFFDQVLHISRSY